MVTKKRRAELLGEPILLSGRVREWQGIVYLAYCGLDAVQGKKVQGFSQEQADRAAWVCGPLLKQIVEEIERAAAASEHNQEGT